MINNDDTRNEDKDYISKLPDTILTHIPSLLPEPDATRTRILSNRWKDLCLSLPNLRFVMPSCPSAKDIIKFHDSVDQTLALRGGMSVQRLLVSCSKDCDYTRVNRWLRIVVECKVEEIELSFPPDRFKVRFCWGLFKTCDTLVALTLKGEFVLDVRKDNLLFPCLKKVNLVSIVYSGDETVPNLISGCPVLEELFVERRVVFDMMQIFKVSSPSLKKLRMLFTESCLVGLIDYASTIDVPKLEYLYIEDKMSSVYSFTKMPFLVEAYVSTSGGAAELLTCLSSAKTLTFTYSTLDLVSSVHGIAITMFPKAVKLVIGVRSISHWNLLLRAFLIFMPNLEQLTFLDGFPLDSAGWEPPVEVPDSLRFKMKEIVILNEKAVTQEQFAFIRFLLQHSTKLETLGINAHEIVPEMREQLMNFHRASNLCRIEFV